MLWEFLSHQLPSSGSNHASTTYQPPGVWEAVAMIGSNTRDYRPDSGDALYRRSLYTFQKRTSPLPMLVSFDASERAVCTVRRQQTNTPLQALVTLNDPVFVDAARALARRMLDLGTELVFLSAGSEEIARVYLRVGFRRMGTACIAEPAAVGAP